MTRITKDEMRMFRARVNKVFLDHLRAMPHQKIRALQRRMRHQGMKIERQDIHPAHLFTPRQPDGPIRTITGYVYPRAA